MISVAIPAYKPQFLRRAVDSVLRQSLEDFELIVVNDRSPYDLDKIVLSVADKRIRYYKNRQNIGKENLASSWNRCLEYAKGDYFVLFSDDDIYEVDFLAEMDRLASKHPDVNIFHSRINVINEDDVIINRSVSLPERESCLDFVWNRLQGHRLQFVAEFMVKTEALRKIGGFIDFPSAWCTDDATWFTLSGKGGVVATNKILCNWRKSRFNVSATGDIYGRLAAVDQFETWFDGFIKNHPCSNPEDARIVGQIGNSLLRKTDNSRLLLMDQLSKSYVDYLYKLGKLYTKRKKYNIRGRLFLRSLLKKTSEVFI